MAQEETVKRRDMDAEELVMLAAAGATLLSLVSAGLGLGLGFYLWG